MNRNLLVYFFERMWTHIFVVATGFAALTHSTWTLSTAFGGHEPVQFTSAWWSWLLPGFMLAFAFDVGQIAISVELRNGERTKPKYIAFATLAISTYFLQWWYLAHHLPRIALAEGMRNDWVPVASFMSDAIIWIAPLLLPVATILYTWSYAAPKRPANRPAKPANASQSHTAIVPASHTVAPATDIIVEMPESFFAECDLCGWHDKYASKRGATNALVAHKRHHHPG
jgi:hypothetical protein